MKVFGNSSEVKKVGGGGDTDESAVAANEGKDLNICGSQENSEFPDHPHVHGDAPKSGRCILDTRDNKFPDMSKPCSLEQFKKWRHDGFNFLEAHPSWFRATRVLHEYRKSASMATNT